MTSEKNRYSGALMGLAAGDALGTTLEFKKPGRFDPISDMVGGGPFRLKAGQWTDDTSMALCLAASLLQCRGFDAADQMNRYVKWWQNGYLSSTGTCFDIGRTVSDALSRYMDTGNPFAGSTNRFSAGNGSLMRLAPVPLFFASDPEKAVAMSAESSRTTHGAAECLDACRYYGGLLAAAVTGISKEKLLSSRFSPVPGLWEQNPLSPKVDKVARGSFKEKKPPEIRGTGYVVDALEAALWAFYHSTDFRDGALLAVNLGDDADTTGAIYGQIAGAFYSLEGIPEAWRERIAFHKEIAAIAEKLHDTGKTLS